ncbi:MAG TPA: NAD(P)-binding domain-containing protein [Anaerolineales bacterium]|nr:NAD(P)-binding domain-containing protein [Anaerolineales bacterium]
MKFGVLGTGVVGQTIGSKLVHLGHDVMMGARDASNPKAVAWAKSENSPRALFGTFANAAAHGEIIFNCTLGTASLNALRMAGSDNLKGKILVDTANPLDYSNNIWSLTVCNTDSLGEQIQREFDQTRVVKTLNTINAVVMVEPNKLSERTDVFVSGNDPEAKKAVTRILRDGFGWISVIDLGDITTARGVEMYVLLWRNFRLLVNSYRFNIKLVSH